MFEISDAHYCQFAENLLDSIGTAEFFNGTLHLETTEYTAQLRVTLLIYRTPRRDPASHSAEDIVDIVPVWWEHHLQTADGEQLSDFDWREFKKYLIYG